MTTSRHPAGSPVGGRFAPGSNAAPAGVALTDDETTQRKTLVRELNETTYFEQPDRAEFDALLPNVPETVRDDAWASVEHITDAQSAIDDGDFYVRMDQNHDQVSVIAWEQARDGEDDLDFFDRMSDGYSDELDSMLGQLARIEMGQAGTYEPIHGDLSGFSVESRDEGFAAA